MHTQSSLASLLFIGLLGLGVFSPRLAHADTSCASNSDCVKGWSCEVTGASGCGYACAPGEACPPPPDCTTVETKSCVPGPCSADSDCAAGMVCYTAQTAGCDDVPTCAPGANCPATTCTPTTVSECIPRYDAPCTADADCGAGFTCTLDSSGCACAGSASPASDGGSDPLPPVTCDCPAATTSSCHALTKACTSAADCVAGWTCELMPSPDTCTTVSTEPAPPGKDLDGGAAPVPAQDAGADPCPPPAPPTQICVPPYYSLSGGSVAAGDSANGSPTLSSESGTAGGSSAPVAAGDAKATPTSTSAGCSVSHDTRKGGASGLALLALGLVGFARRRRNASATR